MTNLTATASNIGVNQKRVAIYARVSTEEQAEHGFSIDAQLETLKDYCRVMNKSVFEEYVDKGVSGKSMKGRLALQKLMEDAKNGCFDEVIVWKINRLARKQLDLLKIVDHLNNNNISFRSFSENFETETPMGKFALQMMGAVGELERNTIVDNVKMGMKQRAKTGKWNGGVIIGYKTIEINHGSIKNKETKLEIVPEEARLVRYIFDLYASGKGLKAITNQLNHEGYKTKNDNPFQISAIRAIISNPIYIGKIRYNVHEGWSEKRRKSKNPDPIIADGEHQAIISEELWSKVQELHALKNTKPPRSFFGSFPLSGMIICPACGYKLVQNKVKNKLKDGSHVVRRYYSCSQWRNKGTAVCNANSINAEYADNFVFSKIQFIACNEVVLKDVVNNINKQRQEQIKPLEAELEHLDKKILEAITKREKYFTLYEEDLIDKDLLNKKFQEITEDVEKLEDRKLALKKDLEDNNSAEIPYEFIKEVLYNFNNLLDCTPSDQKKALLQLIIKEITVTDYKRIDKIKLHFDEKIIKYIIENGGFSEEEKLLLPKTGKNYESLRIRFTVTI